MIHKTEIQYEGGLKQLATDLGDLQYDVLADFLKMLSDKITADSLKDHERGRLKLSHELMAAGEHIATAWVILKPYMPKAS